MAFSYAMRAPAKSRCTERAFPFLCQSSAVAGGVDFQPNMAKGVSSDVLMSMYGFAARPVYKKEYFTAICVNNHPPVGGGGVRRGFVRAVYSKAAIGRTMTPIKCRSGFQPRHTRSLF